ncbi:MAG TPA: AAA family ATPase, partial [Polyangiaceae bacterium]|nr:AAA family ATPase [Polyangiaceae bacterium]
MSDAFVRDLRALAAAGVPIVCVVTHEESRARALVSRAFEGIRAIEWTATRGWNGDDATRGPLAAIEQATEASDAGVYRVMFDLHAWFTDARVVRALRDWVGTVRQVPLVLIMPVAVLPADLDRDARILPLPLPDAATLAAALDSEDMPTLDSRGAPTLNAEGKPGDADDAMVRAAVGLTLEEARRAFRLARSYAGPGEAVARVIREKRGALRRNACLELIDSEVTLEAVGGLDVLKGWLRSRVLAFDARARAFGLAEPRGMLVTGVQGCGKSLVSKATARVLSLPLVRLDFAEVFAAPSAEHTIHEAMRAVEVVAPIVLWVDEIEKGLGGGSDARQARVFGAFLTWLQERRAPVFVAATANEVDRLPPELARRGRFDEVFFVDLPSPTERAQILAVQLHRRGRDPAAYPVADLTRDLEHWSGAEIEQMVQSGLFRAFAGKSELTAEHLRAAARELVPLATLYEEKIQALRQWGHARARRASADRRTIDLFAD